MTEKSTDTDNDTEDKEAGAEERGKSAGGPAGEHSKKLWEEQPTRADKAVYNYISSANFGSANFGYDNGGAGGGNARATGRISESDLADLDVGFVPPPRFAEAAKTLDAERLIFLTGTTGQGKRTAALHLLREAVGDNRIVLLSPRLSGTELAKRTYDEGRGYALIDHAGDSGTDGGFSWRVVRDRLAEVDACLVVTTATVPSGVPPEFRVGDWLAPDMNEVLRERLSVELSDSEFELLDEPLADVVRVEDVAALARRIDDGAPVSEAVQHLDAKAAEAVRAWFDNLPNRRRIAQITTMAFTLGAPARTYESMLGALEFRLEEKAPNEEPTAESSDTMEQVRSEIVEPGGLIVRRDIATDIGMRDAFDFAVPGYQRHVVRALWERYDSHGLWNPVRRWLDDAVDAGELSIALGLAALSEVDMGEVLEIIHPWSMGRRGINGQNAAIWVLTAMVYEDRLAPMVLRIATDWITRGDQYQRSTAARAFSGHIGVRFPHDAANRLWQLSTQSHTVTGDAANALPELFATLVRENANPAFAVNMIVTRIEKFDRPGANSRSRMHSKYIAMRMLTAYDKYTSRRPLAQYIVHHHDNMDGIADMWVASLENRPSRRVALLLFRIIFKDITQHEDDYDRVLRILAEKFGQRLPGTKSKSFATDFNRVVLDNPKNADSKVNVLMRAFVADVRRFAEGDI
ncbi:hypothetical protein [Nocardia bovistercoris]|uniref:Uncharacterized protein n=1 Tax=Nocardia bovistercoris TaxID=2785916 RepID=A0A931N6S1_9NOCA|nr:hypothetical protein [Nocardia bovistercoris]MBH0781264.1 hypothetical protein [Nocardia bovistercoris]